MKEEPTIRNFSTDQVAQRINWLSFQGMKRREIEADLRKRLNDLAAASPGRMGRIVPALIKCSFERAAPLDEKDAARRQLQREMRKMAAMKPPHQGATRASQRRGWLRHMADHGQMPVGARGWPSYGAGPDKLVLDGMATLHRFPRGGNCSLSVLRITSKGLDHLERLERRMERMARKYDGAGLGM